MHVGILLSWSWWATTGEAGTWAQDDAEKPFGSVATQTEWLKTPPLPEWTEKQRFVDAEDVEHLVVATAPFMTPAEAEAELDREMLKKAAQWIGQRFGEEAGTFLELSPTIVRADWMVEHLPVTCMLELPAGNSSGNYPMYRSFAQLAMTDQVVEQVESMWAERQVTLREERQRSKLVRWSIVGGGVLVLLVSLHSYLRMDYLTRGYQTSRLRLLLAAACLGTVGLAGWLLSVIR
jgi:hypothetical protein